MRHPARKLNISLTIFLTCVVTAVVGNVWVVDMVHSGARPLMNICLGAVGFFSAVLLSIHYPAARGYRRLLAGQGLLAQWRVPPEEWRLWLAEHQNLKALYPGYPDRLTPTPNPPADGVEVLLGESSLMVDGDFHWLPAKTNLMQFDSLQIEPGDPLFMNLHITTLIHRDYSTRRLFHALRFPVPESARTAAEAVLEEYRSRPAKLQAKPGKRLPRSLRKVP